MGLSHSKQTVTRDVFSKELMGINHIVNSILNEQDTFRKKEYNFLSHQVCSKYHVILQNDLNKHLKVHLTDLGDSIFLVPKDEDPTQKIRMSKSEVCEQISDHYVKILYILCVIKYIYNLENNGDNSFGGIILRNIKITDNMMEVMFCDAVQKDYSSFKNNRELDFEFIDGFKFFTRYILSNEESKSFMKLLKALLSKKPKNVIKAAICEAATKNTLSPEEYKILAEVFYRNYKEPLGCKKDYLYIPSDSYISRVNTNVVVEKHNPVFWNRYCKAVDKHVIYIDTKEGREVKHVYDKMKMNYHKNIKSIETILHKLVNKTHGGYELQDMSSSKLNAIIDETKTCIRTFILRSLMDYNHLLEMVKNIPNVKISGDQNVF